MRIFLLLFLLLVPTPASPAGGERPGISTAVPVRYEKVFIIADYACNLLSVEPGKQVHGRLRQIMDKFRLTRDEMSVLINHCMLYEQGYKKGLTQ